MAFLDNSGDIILDAVLTDTGRYRLAKGDGTFKITQFSLGDDEIDYSLYDINHPSGTVYYDLNILQTPVLEALTDNASALKSHLLTINQTDLLFMPVIKLCEKEGSVSFNNQGFFAVCVDEDTVTLSDFFKNTDAGTIKEGVFQTYLPSGVGDPNFIRLDQGLDTQQIPPTQEVPQDLRENMFMIEMDERLGSLIDPVTRLVLPKSYVDDDQIATYFVTITSNTNVVKNISSYTEANASSIAGPRATSLNFKVVASNNLQNNNFLFDQLGTVTGTTPNKFKIIDSTVRVTGATTGYRIDVPIRFYKYTT